MNQEWSLDVLYHGYEDPKFDEDMKKFESEVAGMKEKIEAAKKLDPVKGLETCLMAKESMKAREIKRAKLVARYAEKREALKKLLQSQGL